MSKQIIILGALGAVAFMVYQKTKTGGASRPVTQAATDLPSKNVLGDMWSKLLGTPTWKNMLGATEANGSQAFIMRDWLGRPVTSDGVPIGSGDYLYDSVTMLAGQDALPLIDEYRGMGLYDSVQDLYTGNWTTNGGTSPLDQWADGLKVGGGGVDFQAAQPFAWARSGE